MRYFTRKRIITGSALILAVLITAFSLDYYFTGLHKAPEPDNNYIPEPRVEYGIVVDSFQVIKDEVKANENLSTILLQYNLNMGIIEQLVQKAAGIFDVRKIKVGNKYTVLLANDSVPTAHYFIYESSPTQYVIFEAGDSIMIKPG
jgi:hypothetical protein